MKRRSRRGNICGITTIDASTAFKRMVDTGVVLELVPTSLCKVAVALAFSQRKCSCCRSRILMI
jgi:hypothetical protein